MLVVIFIIIWLLNGFSYIFHRPVKRKHKKCHEGRVYMLKARKDSLCLLSMAFRDKTCLIDHMDHMDELNSVVLPALFLVSRLF